jgi:hypothetical protein
MADYHVAWEINVEAETAAGACEFAASVLKTQNLASFLVTDATGETTQIDSPNIIIGCSYTLDDLAQCIPNFDPTLHLLHLKAWLEHHGPQIEETMSGSFDLPSVEDLISPLAPHRFVTFADQMVAEAQAACLEKFKALGDETMITDGTMIKIGREVALIVTFPFTTAVLPQQFALFATGKFQFLDRNNWHVLEINRV